MPSPEEKKCAEIFRGWVSNDGNNISAYQAEKLFNGLTVHLDKETGKVNMNLDMTNIVKQSQYIDIKDIFESYVRFKHGLRFRMTSIELAGYAHTGGNYAEASSFRIPVEDLEKYVGTNYDLGSNENPE